MPRSNAFLAAISAVAICGGGGGADKFGQDAGDTSTDTSGDHADMSADAQPDTNPPEGACPPGWACRTAGQPAFSGVDILVVVDDSRSMAEEQESMVTQFPTLIQNFLNPPVDPLTGAPLHAPILDLHIGVISTDMGTGGFTVPTCGDPIDGDDGILQHTPLASLPGCEPAYPPFLSYDVDVPDPAAVDWMGTAFGCVATLGTEGCGMEQQMEAALKALTVHAVPSGANAGFLRDDTVLLVMWLTDEEDCSVSDTGIFNVEDPLLGPLNIRCFQNPDMIHPVSRYISGLRDLRAGTPWPMLLGMIVGVPPDEAACNGFGDELDGCLEVTDMQERIDPEDPSALLPSCTSTSGSAFPPRRFVGLAEAFGHDAYVHSICQVDFMPALEALSGAVNDIADRTCEGSIVEMVKHPGDPCLCDSDCRVVHVLPGSGACPSGTEIWDHDGDGVPNHVTDADGDLVTACEVPAAGTEVSNCVEACEAPTQDYSPVGTGWYYDHTSTGVSCPAVSFTAGFATPPGAITIVACP